MRLMKLKMCATMFGIELTRRRHLIDKADFIAIFDFAKETPDELEMSKADLMCSVADSKPENGWLLVKNLRTDFEGYVPYSYLRRIEHIEQQPWYFEIDRHKAEKLLRRFNTIGSYMVRKSHLDKGCLILSVFNGPNTTRTRGKDVVHYLIRFNDTLERFIFDYFNFESVDHLINYYSGQSDLCQLLTVPYPKQSSEV